jgi:hypothetical protein
VRALEDLWTSGSPPQLIRSRSASQLCSLVSIHHNHNNHHQKSAFMSSALSHPRRMNYTPCNKVTPPIQQNDSAYAKRQDAWVCRDLDPHPHPSDRSKSDLSSTTVRPAEGYSRNLISSKSPASAAAHTFYSPSKLVIPYHSAFEAYRSIRRMHHRNCARRSLAFGTQCFGSFLGRKGYLGDAFSSGLN